MPRSSCVQRAQLEQFGDLELEDEALVFHVVADEQGGEPVDQHDLVANVGAAHAERVVDLLVRERPGLGAQDAGGGCGVLRPERIDRDVARQLELEDDIVLDTRRWSCCASGARRGFLKVCARWSAASRCSARSRSIAKPRSSAW